MIKNFAIFLCCLLLPISSIAQRGEKSNESFISISSALNYYPAIPTYRFFSSFDTSIDDELILNFITSNSGTFLIEEGTTVVVERENTSDFPSQIIGVGVGVRIQKESNLVHELSLTKFSLAKSSHFISYTFLDADEIVGQSFRGYEQKSGAFAFRYEIGKIFGDNKNRLRFGLTGGLEPTYYFFKWTSLSQNDFPVKAKIYTVDFSLIPRLTIALGKKMFLDFKVVSNLLVADFSPAAEEYNPSLAPSMRAGEKQMDVPDISWAFTLQFRYNIKEPKRKRR